MARQFSDAGVSFGSSTRTRRNDGRIARKRASALQRSQMLSVERLEDRTLFSTLYWDPSQAATANGGTGTWNTTSMEWRANSSTGPLVAWSNSAGYDVVFPASAGTVTLGTSVTAKSLTFNASGYTINGSSGSTTLTLSGGTGQIDVPSGDSEAISANISGSSVVTKVDSGTLTLSGTNSYTGATILSAGQLNINSATAIGSGTFNINGGTIDNTSMAAVTLSTNNAQIWSGNFTYNGSYSLNLGTGGVTLTGNRTVTAVTKTLTVGGVISDGGSGFGITKSSYGLLLLGAANTFSGQTTINNGGIQINNGNALQNSTVDVAGTGPLTFGSGIGSVTLGSLAGSYAITDQGGSSAVALSVGNNSATSTYSGVLSGSGSLKVIGGTETLSGANTFTGGTTITAGTLKLSGSGTPGATSGSLTVNGGTLDLNGTSQTVGSLTGSGGTILDNIASASTLTDGGGTTTYWGNISSGTGTLGLALTGTASLTLTGSNTYAGTTTIGSSAALKIGSGGAIHNIGTGTIVDNNVLTFNTSSALSVANTISGSGSLIQAGTGATTLSASNNYSGGTAVSAGTLSVTNTAGSATGLGSVIVSGGTLSGTGTISGAVNISSGATLAPGASGLGVLSIGALTLSSGSYLAILLDGNTAGTNYSRLNVSGGSTFTGSNLVLSGTRNAEDNSVLTPVHSTSAVTGTFNGIAQGGTIASNGVPYVASYTGGTGDDFTLTASIGIVTLVGGSGNDTFNIHYNSSGPVFTFSGGTGTYPSVYSSSVSVSLQGGGGNDSLSTDGGTVTLVNDASSGGSQTAISVGAGANLSLITTQHLSSLSIGAGATVDMAEDGDLVLVTSGLTIAGSAGAWTGSLDLFDNDAIVHGGNNATITSQLASGFNTGYWTGSGIRSSVAALSPHPETIEAVGSMVNANGGTAIYSTFDGQTVTSTDVLIGYTYYGDNNLDKVVNAADETLEDNGYYNHLTGWYNGDYSYDGTVDGSDYTLSDNAYNFQFRQLPVARPGVSYSISVPTSGFTPSSSWLVDWGDGTLQPISGDPSTLSHTYASSGTYAVGMTGYINNSGGAGSLYAIPTRPLTVTSIPNAPSGLTATGVSDDEIDLSWTNNATNQAGFDVERSVDGVNYSIIAATTATTYTDTESGREPGGTYFYKAAAYNGSLTSAYSASASATLVLPDLPAVSYSTPYSNPTLPSEADTFNPPVASQTLASGAPAIAATNLDANPDDTLTLTGANFTDDSGSDFADARFIVYGQTNSSNGTISDAELQSTSSNGVLATIPSSEPSGSMYFVWPQNNSGVGAPVAVNQTDAQWFSPSSPIAGQTVSVYGRNLQNSSGQSWVYLQPTNNSAGQWVSTTSVNPYCVQFTLPSTFPAGASYQIWVYNGMGGKYGWSSPTSPSSSFTVGSAVTWNSSWVNVTSYGAVGYGSTDDYSAIESAISHVPTDGVLYFPAGTYEVNNNAVQNLLIQGNNSFGTYTLNYGGQTTSTLAYNATASQIQTALNSLSDMGSGGAVVTGSGGSYSISFNFINDTPITVNTSNLPDPGNAYVSGTDQIILPSNVQVRGDGMNSSVIRFDGNVPSLGYGAFDIGAIDFYYEQNIDFESIGLTFNGPTFGQGGPQIPAVVRERFANNMTFNNVLITANNLTSIDWEASSNLTLTNSTVVSVNTNINAPENVVLDNDSFLQDYGRQVTAVTFINAVNVSMTDCTTENYYDFDPSLGSEGFSDGAFVEFDSDSRFVYCSDNTSINLGEGNPPVDHNSGQQMGTEGGYDVDDSGLVSVTSDTVTFAGNISAGVGTDVFVLSGSGMGQQLSVTGSTYNSSGNQTTFTLNRDFTVIPSTSDNVDLAETATNLVFYQNVLNHSTGAYANEDDSSGGFEFFNAGYGIVVDGNTVNDTRSGVSLWSYGLNAPSAFDDIINNTFNNIQTGITLVGSTSSIANFYGVAVRNNNIYGSTASYNSSLTAVAGFNLDFSETSTPVVVNLATFEHNTVTGFQVGVAASDDPDTLMYKNTFNLGSGTHSGSAGVSYETSPSTILLQGNSFAGYQNTYDAFYSLPDPMLEVPQHGIYLDSVSSATAISNIVLSNSGPSTLSWSGSTDESWLTFQTTSGTISADSSTPASGSGAIALLANPTGLSVGNYFSTVTITFDTSETLELDVELIVQH